jgi:hypothetical protein
MKIAHSILAALLITSGIAQAQIIPVGSQKPAAPKEPELIYRDPAQTITIGEMSNRQAAAESEKFLNKLGYTGVQKVDPAKLFSEQAKKNAEKPANQMKFLGVYGEQSSLSADISVNGHVYKVTGPGKVGIVNVISVQSDALKVSFSNTNKRCPVKSKDQKTGRMIKKHIPCVSESVMKIGDSVEWR